MPKFTDQEIDTILNNVKKTPAYYGADLPKLWKDINDLTAAQSEKIYKEFNTVADKNLSDTTFNPCITIYWRN